MDLRRLSGVKAWAVSITAGIFLLLAMFKQGIAVNPHDIQNGQIERGGVSSISLAGTKTRWSRISLVVSNSSRPTKNIRLGTIGNDSAFYFSPRFG